jgi:hypothetical protein
MNSKPQKTLHVIFAKPISATIEWRKIEQLLIALGCKCIVGEDSTVSFSFENYRLDLHRPHPGKEAKRYQVKDVQTFLLRIGIQP